MIYPTWYGLMYVFSFGLAFHLLPKLQKYRSVTLTKDDWLFVLALGVAGVMLGGRLGYVFFYEPTYFLNNPSEILAIWNGGMSSHGGFIGVALALGVASRYLKVTFLSLLDIVVIPVAFGLALGRLGNYINQELFIGQGAWLAIVSNVFIAGVCYYFLTKSKVVGQVGAVFLMLYSIFRFLTEFARLQPWPEVWGLTYGQALTIPLFVIGFCLWLYTRMQTDS